MAEALKIYGQRAQINTELRKNRIAFVRLGKAKFHINAGINGYTVQPADITQRNQMVHDWVKAIKEHPWTKRQNCKFKQGLKQ